MSRTITLLTSGTRGDVVPYIALGKGLREEGYNVRIAAPIGFENLVRISGIAFAPFIGNPTDLMIEKGDLSPLTLGRNPIQSIRVTREFIHRARPIYRKMLHAAAEACRGSDVIVCGLPTLWGSHIAEGLRIPVLRAFLQPLAPTREFPSALLPFRFSLWGIGNRLSHRAVIQSIWLSWRSEINHARRADFGLAPAHWLDPSLRADSNQPLTLNGFSELVVPRPQDWNEKQVITGYWRLKEVTRRRVDELEEVQRFIDAAKNPIAIGFGSPGTRGYLPMLEEALNLANAQAVLTIPAKWHGDVKSKNIFPIEYIPHDWLYPRMRAAVHHGGAGTTSASLHAGIPTIVLPLGIDQFFWGERVQELGAGSSIPQRKLNAQNLAQAIHAALNNKEMKAKSKAISKLLSEENGVQNAVNVLRSVL